MRTNDLSIAGRDGHTRHLPGLDLVRAAAILMVMVDHLAPRGDVPGAPSSLVSDLLGGLLCGPNAVLFIMLSGALLLPVSGSWREFLVRRAKRILRPFVVWSVVYALVYQAYYGWPDSFVWFQLRWGWLVPTFPQGWFITVIGGVYLVMPLLSPWLRSCSQRQLQFVLLLWLASGLLPYLTYVMGVTDYGQTFVGPFVGYTGYALAGYYLMRYPLRSLSACGRWGFCTGGIVFGVMMPLIPYFLPLNFPAQEYWGRNLSLNVMCWGMLLFTLMSAVESMPRWLNAIIRLIARNAFGIYLIHGALFKMASLHLDIAGINGWVVAAAVVCASLVLSELLRRIPAVGRFVV